MSEAVHQGNAMAPKAPASRFAGLGAAGGMAVALLLLSFARLAGDATSMAFKDVVLDSVLEGSVWGTALGRNLALFAGALLLLHGAFGFTCWLLALASEYAFPGLGIARIKWVALWFLFLAAAALVCNAAAFPHSSLGEPYARLVRTPLWAGVDPFALVTAAIVIAVASVTVAAARRTLRARRVAPIRVAVAGIASIAAVVLLIAATSTPTASGATHGAPHVILVGIDSLRHDSTDVSGGPSLAPNVSRFLTKAVTFSDATTPLARTFPSWVSILTGRHPHTTGAVMNLLPRDLVHEGDTLGDMLQRAGYRTVYAIDEVRFSNVDRSYGFDDAITPPIGASDFLIGWFGDTPLSNLVMNSRVGAALFPHLYANRAAAVTYDPDEFIRRVDRRLAFDTPTFLAVHLTLVHWPFRWADSAPLAEEVEPRVRYSHTVPRVDRQFADLMAMLERRGALGNAIVVVLSDHGEALGEPDTLLRNAHELGESYRPLETPYGHGTSVLSPVQYQVVLGMRAFGTHASRFSAPRIIDAPVSLEDVTPTLADLLDLQPRGDFDGRSLVPLLTTNAAAADSFRGRIRFTETEFNVAGLMSSGNVSTNAIVEAATFYTVDRVTDRLEVRRERVAELLRDRQYAALIPGRLVAALPAAGGRYELLGVGDDGRARRLRRRHVVDPESDRLLSALESRFGLEARASPDRATE
jgi:hypothetical protein